MAPLGSKMTDLYLWAVATASAAHYQRDIADIWQKLGGRAVSDSEVIERDGRLWHDYQSLAHSIRRRVVAAQAKVEQLSFFD